MYSVVWMATPMPLPFQGQYSLFPLFYGEKTALWMLTNGKIGVGNVAAGHSYLIYMTWPTTLRICPSWWTYRLEPMYGSLHRQGLCPLHKEVQHNASLTFNVHEGFNPKINQNETYHRKFTWHALYSTYWLLTSVKQKKQNEGEEEREEKDG